jgi:hypothetical protein
LALSGGGIRSATFSLGVIQALAAKKKLASFDYLSTVSGGGYIGAWLTAWIHRSNLATVQSALAQQGSGNEKAPKSSEPEELSWLRRYSNYLTPRVGLFSTDSLTLIATWLRNVLLNLIIVIAFFALLTLFPRLALYSANTLATGYSVEMGYVSIWLGTFIFAAIISNLLHMERPSDESQFWMVTSHGVALTVLFPGTIAAITGSFWLLGSGAAFEKSTSRFTLWTAILMVLVWLGWLGIELWRAYKDGLYSGARWARVKNLFRAAGVFAVAGVIAVAVGVGLMAYVHRQFQLHGTTHDMAALLAFGPAALLVIFGITGSIFVGLVGRTYYERSREWWSRMSASFFTIGAAWLLLTSCAFYVPAFAEWAYASAGPWLKSIVGAGWLASLAGALLGAKRTGLSKQARISIMAVLNLAAIVFMLGFVITTATLTERMLASAAGIDRVPVSSSIDASKLDLRISGSGANLDAHVDVRANQAAGLLEFVRARRQDLDALVTLKRPWPVPFLWSAFIATLTVLLIFGLRVDVNKFSLHNLYKNRLIRCYLGASNARRSAQPFTGFDDNDDFPVADLAKEEPQNVQRPFHIINAALNISQGKNLAWQERKAASFVFTPLYTGFSLAKTQGETTEKNARTALSKGALGASANRHDIAVPGYRPTRQYAGNDQEERSFSLGMAIATSGAAASPNMGPSTSPALAFVLTLFNVRIGRWSPNPALNHDKWKRPSPPFGFICLLQELFGFSNEESSFVYLSDGGHFDNMGIYELVRRRCKIIWLVDAAADTRRSFEDLGRAIRQCRIDFGVEIVIELNHMRAAGDGKLPHAGFAEGTIRYGSQWEDGKIIYIKPTLCEGNREPVDVLNYGTRNPSFPHQSTADQFFDESQFESYRRLGMHIGERCLEKHHGTLPTVEPDDQLSPIRAPYRRSPHPLQWWFWRLLVGTIICFLLLSVIQRYWLPKLSDAKDSAEKACMLMLYASEADPACPAGVPMPIVKPPLPEAPDGARAPGLMAEFDFRRLTVPEIFVWIDNVTVVFYTAMFIVGFFLIKSRLFRPGMARGSLIFLIGVTFLALAGAFFDYGENTLLLAGIGAAADKIAHTAKTVQIWTEWKIIIAVLNFLLLLILGMVSVFVSRRSRP